VCRKFGACIILCIYRYIYSRSFISFTYIILLWFVGVIIAFPVTDCQTKRDGKLITGCILMEYFCCFITTFNDTTGTASSYGLLATRYTRSSACVYCGVRVSPIRWCVCVLCPTRVPPEIKTCNFVVVNVRRACAQRLTRYYRAEAQAAVM